MNEINRLHSIKGLASIPKTSFYGLIEQYMASMHPGDRKELKWFVGKKIEVFDSYDLHKARQTLFDIFTFSGLKTFAGEDLKGIHKR